MVGTYNNTMVILCSSTVQLKVPGEYIAYKVSLKCGSLEFVTTLKPELSQQLTVSVQPNQVNADILLTPQLGGKTVSAHEIIISLISRSLSLSL